MVLIFYLLVLIVRNNCPAQPSPAPESKHRKSEETGDRTLRLCGGGDWAATTLRATDDLTRPSHARERERAGAGPGRRSSHPIHPVPLKTAGLLPTFRKLAQPNAAAPAYEFVRRHSRHSLIPASHTRTSTHPHTDEAHEFTKRER